jgi:hypothetical protein
MVIAADNVTVNLDGHTIRAVPPDYGQGRGGVEVLERRGVTIKNGTIFSGTYGLFVEGGGGHSFRNLHARVFITEVDRTLVKRITSESGADPCTSFYFLGDHRTISRVTARKLEHRGVYCGRSASNLGQRLQRGRGQRRMRSSPLGNPEHRPAEHADDLRHQHRWV